MTTIRRLYLDDIRNPPDDGLPWIVCRMAERAIDALKEGVDIASLDHDLGECPDCEARRGYQDAQKTCPHTMTGYDLVLWMAEHDVWPRQKPRVHSMNPVGAANMRAVIERYWHEPDGEV